MAHSPSPPSRRRQRGFTLVDVVLLVVLLGVVGGSLTTLFTRLSVRSALVLRDRQILAAAQALLNEVKLMPFTYCDPQDTRAALATGAFNGGTGCTSQIESFGAEAGEGRKRTAATAASAIFDNVNDYTNWAQPGTSCPSGLCDINGNLLNGAGSPLQNCSTLVSATSTSMTSVTGTDAYGLPQSLRITVRVTCPPQPPLYVEAMRLRHSPNAF